MTTLVPCRSSRSWVQTANIKLKRNTNLKHQETSNSGKRSDQSPDSSPNVPDSRNTVTLPLSGFSDFWDDATGEAIKTCQENKIYCHPG